MFVICWFLFVILVFLFVGMRAIIWVGRDLLHSINFSCSLRTYFRFLLLCHIFGTLTHACSLLVFFVILVFLFVGMRAIIWVWRDLLQSLIILCILRMYHAFMSHCMKISVKVCSLLASTFCSCLFVCWHEGHNMGVARSASITHYFMYFANVF
jgi:hypothetical protein